MPKVKPTDFEQKRRNVRACIAKSQEERCSNMDREQTTIRLTIRATEELDGLIRQEAARRGMSVNQVMLYILNRHFSKSDNSISPLEDS